jgi:hypothetical protein
MEIKGIIKKIFEVQTGEGKNGAWQKQELIITYGGQYPKDVVVTCFGKVVDSVEQLTEGMGITAHVNPESREYNGKYFTNINAWKLDFVGGKNVAPKKPQAMSTLIDDISDDDLPFN